MLKIERDNPKKSPWHRLVWSPKIGRTDESDTDVDGLYLASTMDDYVEVWKLSNIIRTDRERKFKSSQLEEGMAFRALATLTSLKISLFSYKDTQTGPYKCADPDFSTRIFSVFLRWSRPEVPVLHFRFRKIRVLFTLNRTVGSWTRSKMDLGQTVRASLIFKI